MEQATFAAGCFWGIEEAFRRLPGVVEAISGYTGGHIEHPTYAEVCTGETGHAEAVEVTFDPEKISYEDLLKRFWTIHDPTQVDRQGPDIGSQYRSAIFYRTEAQHIAAENSKKARQAQTQKTITTNILPETQFYPAEDYHQRFYQKNPHITCHIL